MTKPPGHGFLNTVSQQAKRIERLESALHDILGDKGMSDILWRDQPDDEMVTITIKLGRYRKAQAALHNQQKAADK